MVGQGTASGSGIDPHPSGPREVWKLRTTGPSRFSGPADEIKCKANVRCPTADSRAARTFASETSRTLRSWYARHHVQRPAVRYANLSGSIREVTEMPNLIEVQKASYDPVPHRGRAQGRSFRRGLQAVFKSVFPITDFSNTASLEFVKYEFEQPKYDVDECRQRDMTFAAPLKVTLRLIVFEVDEETGAALGQGHQGAGRLHGRHALHDVERHLHRQRHRARDRFTDAPLAGRLLRPRQGQDPLVRQAAVCRAHHPVSRFLARPRVRRQGHRLCAYRPSPQDSGSPRCS